MRHQDLLFSKGICVVPIVMLLIFVGFYFASQKFFVQCLVPTVVNCSAIQTELLAASNPQVENIDTREKGLGYLSRLEKQYSGRMLWIFFAAANVLICLCVLTVFLLIAARWVGWRAGSTLILVSLLIGAISSFFDPLFLAGPLFRHTIEQAGWAGIQNFASVNRSINILSLACAVGLALVVAVVIFADDESSNGSSGVEPKILAAKRDDLKLILYTATVSLVVGLLRLDQAYSWATVFVLDTQLAAISKTFFSSVTGTLGGFYTLLLAAVYVPAAFIIYSRAKAVIGDQAVPEEWSTSAFTFSFADTLPRILAIAGPLLAGPLAELLKRI